MTILPLKEKLAMNQKVYKQIKKFIDAYGLPKEIGATGWVVELSQWTYNDQVIGSSNEESKGWISVTENTHRLNSLNFNNYWDTDSVYAIATAICSNNTLDTQLYFEIYDKQFVIDLYNEDADGKGWEWIDGEENLDNIVRKIKGYPIDINHENYDDFDEDSMDFLWSECEENIVETSYTLPYDVCFITWSNGAQLHLTWKNGGFMQMKEVKHPPVDHNVFVYIKSAEYLQEIQEWLTTNECEHTFLSRPEPEYYLGVNFKSGDHATLFGLKFS